MSISKKSDTRLRKGFILLLLSGVTIGFLGMIRDFLIALLLAAVIASLLYPFYLYLRHLLWHRPMLASGATLTIALLAFGLPLVSLVSIIAADAMQISQQVRPSVQQALASDVPISNRVPEWLSFVEVLEPYREIFQDKFAEAAASLGSWIVKYAANATQDTLRFFLSLFIMLYAMFFFLINGPEYLRAFKSLLPLSTEDRDLVMARGVSVTRASLKGIIVIGVMQGVLVGFGLWMCSLSAPVFWGTIVFVLSAIPGLGAPMVWLPAAVYLMMSGSVGWGIGLVLWGVLVVGLIDNIVRPLIVGRDAKLPDLVILVAILGGIASFGAVGIILGPIVAAILDTLLNIYRRAFADLLLP